MASFMDRIGFDMMALTFKVRDLFSPPEGVLLESGISEGFKILDYGCGPGSYSVSAARLVGSKGEVYAADMSPIAMKCVKKAILKNRLNNIKVIQTDCATNLPDNSIDVVLLYDIYHGLKQPQRVLQELYRVLKSEGTLSFSDHHMKEEDIIYQLTKDRLFKLSHKGNKTFSFIKE